MNRREFNKNLLMASMLQPISMQTETDEKIKFSTFSPLKTGDTVALIAPGSPIKEEKFINALENLKTLGLKPKYTDIIFKKNGYLAGTDQERVNEIHTYFEDENVNAIWCLRGGYGCTRILPMIDYKLIKKNKKIFIGYSDITALLYAFNKKSNLTGFHGPVLISQIFTSHTLQNVRELLFQEKKVHSWKHIYQSDISQKQEFYIIKEGIASGKLIGGNLTLMNSLIGTEYNQSYKNKIVFIEEVGEKPYRIDRMLVQLLQSTDLKKCNGIILGIFNDCEPKEGEFSYTLKETLMQNLQNLNIPVFYGFPFGHISDISSFPIGIEATMNSKNMTIDFNSPF